MKKKLILSLCLAFTMLNANNFTNPQHTRSYTQAPVQQNLHRVFNAYHKLAVKGSPAAQYEVALIFHYGASGIRQNSELAKLWFKRASLKGHRKAQSILYRFYAGARPQFMPKQRLRYSINTRR